MENIEKVENHTRGSVKRKPHEGFLKRRRGGILWYKQSNMEDGEEVASKSVSSLAK